MTISVPDDKLLVMVNVHQSLKTLTCSAIAYECAVFELQMLKSATGNSAKGRMV